MTMMEMEPQTPTSMEQALLGQLITQVATHGAQVAELTKLVKQLLTSDAARTAAIDRFVEPATNTSSNVQQLGAMLREQRSLLERQEAKITALTTAVEALTSAVNGVLDLVVKV